MSNRIIHDAKSLTITRLFDAPRALVWEAWTNPDMLSQWWGPAHHPATRLNMDVRSGGTWRNCLTSVETGKGLWQNGQFLEVVPMERLVFSFVWEETGERGDANTVTITFADLGGQTLMTLHQALFQSAAEAAGHGEGWSSSFERLQDCLNGPAAQILN